MPWSFSSSGNPGGFNMQSSGNPGGFVPIPIITAGLVTHLDAVQLASYPGTGTTWTDLTGNGNNLTATDGIGGANRPTFNSAGHFTTGTTGYFTGAGTATIPTGNSNYTMQCWVRNAWGTIGGSTRKGIISIGGFNINNQSNAFRLQDNATLGHFIHYWWANDLSSNNNNANLVANTWFLATAQFDGTNRRIWANTTNTASDTPGNSHNVTSTLVQVGRTSSSEYFQGDIAVVYIYNRALSAAEIRQNYNALRGRFGI